MYDYLILTNQPAFYKINLYNKINEKSKIFVIYLGKGSQIRNKDFINEKMDFEHIFLYEGQYEERKKIRCTLKIVSMLIKKDFRKIIIGGWDEIEYWVVNMIVPKLKNCLAVESSYYESNTQGFKGLFKKAFLKKIGVVFASGEDQIKLIQQLGYSGRIIKTRGVGIFNKKNRHKINKEKFKEKHSFLCVARLSEEKNLELLIDAFNELNEPLSIVRTGPLEKKLRSRAKDNISFLGYISNKDLYEVYIDNSIFILPSKAEPWGLVVDEALYYGLPVIVSDKVGCKGELVSGLNTGLIFKFNDQEDLKNKIKEMKEEFEKYVNNIERLDFDERDMIQVDAYLKEVKKI